MGILRSPSNNPTVLNAVKINQSCQGLPLPVILGKHKVQQSILWQDGFEAWQGPGAKGGGKGGQELYAADTICGLCEGPIVGVDSVWFNQSWLYTSDIAEDIATPSSGIYTPNYASTYSVDAGAGTQNSYSVSAQDLGAPAPTILGGSFYSSMQKVAYGSLLTQGQYSINADSVSGSPFTVTSCDNASGGNTVYHGTFAGGTSNGLVGYTFVIWGFLTTANNSGSNDATTGYICVASTGTTLTLANAYGVAETHAATATEPGNTYHFSSYDAANATPVQISYSYGENYITAQDIEIIPSGRSFNVGYAFWYGVDLGCVYYGVDNPKNGVALTPTASNPPTAAGTYHFISSGKSSGGSQYIFSTADIGQEVLVTYYYRNDNALEKGAPTTLNFTTFNGAAGQAPWSLLTDSFPGAVLGYTATAYAGYNPMQLGGEATIPNITYEVQTADGYGGGVVDCNPIQCIFRVLTDPVWGLGSGVTPFPLQIMDSGPLGTWGGPAVTVEPTVKSTGSQNATAVSVTGSDWSNTQYLLNGSGSAVKYAKTTGGFGGGGTATLTFSGLNVPTNAIIQGVVANITALEPIFTTVDILAQLSHSGSPIGSPQASFIEPGAPQVLTFGSTTSVWGAALTPAIINSLAVAVKNNTANTGYLFNATVAVYYTLPAGSTIQESTAWSWFAANGFFISPNLDKQDSVSSVMGKWLEAGMCAGFMSEGLFKLVPYGDTTTAGYGCVWNAPSEFVVALDDTCFIGKDGEELIKISRSPYADAYNYCQVKWSNRQNQYSPEVTPEWDQAAINRFTRRIEAPQDYDFVCTLPAATFSASMRVKRSVSIRNTYEGTLPFIYSYLEPMDIVEVTTGSEWAQALISNANLGLVALPMRVIKTVDDPIEGIRVTLEDYPYGVGQPVLFNKGLNNSSIVTDFFATPGSTEVVLFEATSRLTGYTGNQIWIGAAGASNQWGGCNIWVSADNENYLEIGTIKQAARIGELNSTFPSGPDPDIDDVLVIDLAENCPPLDAGSNNDADQGNTLCFLDGEIIAYSTCTTTGQEQFTMNIGAPSVPGYIRRGQMGSTISAHVPGAFFVRLDNTIFKYTYDPVWAGKTLYFKFASFNRFENSTQDLSTLTAVPFTVPGKGPGTVEAGSGLVLLTQPTVTFSIVGFPLHPIMPVIGVGRLGWTETVRGVLLSPLAGSPTLPYSGPFFQVAGTTLASETGTIDSPNSIAGGSFNFISNAVGNIASATYTPQWTFGDGGDVVFTATIACTCAPGPSGGDGVVSFGIANGPQPIGSTSGVIFYSATASGVWQPWQVSSGNFNISGGNRSVVTTGIYPSTANQTLTVTVKGDGSLVTFAINGATVATFSSPYVPLLTPSLPVFFAVEGGSPYYGLSAVAVTSIKVVY